MNGHLLAYLMALVSGCAFFYQNGVNVGIERGRVAALNLSPPSEDLEAACAGLWIGEQNRIYHRRENGNR